MIQGLPNLGLGVVAAEVGNWQRHLLGLGYADWYGIPIKVDEDFGQLTTYCTRQWQIRAGFSPTGVFGPKERELACEQGFIPFVQAKSYTSVHPKTRKIRVLVIHTMENPEKPESAENVALWFGGKSAYPAPAASAHYCIDLDSTVQCVRDMDVAWHAPGVNNDGIGIEHAGRASQTAEEWNDAASRMILWRSAKLVSRLCSLYTIPFLKLSPKDLLAGKRGIIGHVDATKTYPGPGRTHTDPGKNFPWEHYLLLLQTAQRNPTLAKEPT
jgi:N-acetyl-anhydromuramyl-L-alanine amidase AmpD